VLDVREGSKPPRRPLAPGDRLDGSFYPQTKRRQRAQHSRKLEQKSIPFSAQMEPGILPVTRSFVASLGNTDGPTRNCAAVVFENSSPLRRPLIVVVQHPSEPRPPSDPTADVVVRAPHRRTNDSAVEPLVVALLMIVDHEFLQRMSKMPLPHDNEVV
jgi:hypothetical protein